MMYVGIIILLNIAFAVMIWRISTWFKFKAEDFWFYMINLNLVAMLLFINEYYKIAVDYPFVVKFLVVIVATFVIMEVFKKPIVSNIKTLMEKLPKE